MDKIIENISNPVIVIDSAGQIVFLNAAAKRIQTLHSPPLQVGGNLLNSVRHQWKEIMKNIIHDVELSKSISSLEADYVVDGKVLVFDVRCSPMYDTSGHLYQIMFEMRDITLQKIYERKIRAAANDFSGLIETANAFVIGVDTVGYITEWNDYATEVTGYLKQEMLTRHFSEFFLNGENQQFFRKIIDEALSGNIVANRELSINTKTKGKLNLLINAASQKNPDKEVIGVLIIGQDITELTDYRISLERKVQERTEALQKAIQKEKELVEIKNRFVSMASHEFRSPLSVIKLQVESLKKNLSTTQFNAAEKLDTIFTQAEHMSALLEDVLLTNKSSAGKIEVNVRSVDLRSFLEQTILDVEQATKNTHCIQLDFPVECLIIRSDEKILRNIFVNLLTNAIKFSPGQKKAFLNVRSSGSGIRIDVIDKGVGISATDMERVFQPFNRGKNVQDISGTGLGLSIVKKAVEMLNGKLSVESKLNEGTTFSVYLNPDNDQ